MLIIRIILVRRTKIRWETENIAQKYLTEYFGKI